MKAELHTTPDVFDTLVDEWDGLLDPNRSDNFFLKNFWQRIWWSHLHRGSLCVVSVRDDSGILRGIGSWFVEETNGRHTVRIVGCADVTDYMDLIIMPGYEDPVLRTLLNFMLSDVAPHWDLFDLCNIPETSPTIEVLPRLAREYGLSVESVVQEVCPIVRLPATYDDYLESLDRKQRHELRRKRRRAEAEGVSWHIVGPEHDLDAEIDSFLELMAMSTTAKSEFLKESGHRAFFREIAHATFKQGLLNLIFLTVGSRRAATMWQFFYRDRVLLYNSGLNPVGFSTLSPGIVLLTYGIEDAIRRGMAVYDFLRGDEVYKYRMGAQDTRVYNIVVRR